MTERIEYFSVVRIIFSARRILAVVLQAKIGVRQIDIVVCSHIRYTSKLKEKLYHLSNTGLRVVVDLYLLP